MTIQKALHTGDDKNRLYVSRKEAARWHTSIEDTVDTSERRFEDFIKRAKEDWLPRPKKKNNMQHEDQQKNND